MRKETCQYQRLQGLQEIGMIKSVFNVKMIKERIRNIYITKTKSLLGLACCEGCNQRT